MRPAGLGLVLLAGAAWAAPRPQDFASAFPVSAGAEGAYAVPLGEEVLGAVQRPDLADLAAFNAKGEPLAFGPLPESLAPPAGAWRAARWFWLPAGVPEGGDLHLHVRRAADGALEVDARALRGRAAPTGRDLLVDVGAGEREWVEGLAFELAPDAGAFSAQVVVEASEDLQSWSPAGGPAALARLQQGGETLVRRHVELSPARPKYLRVRASGAGGRLPITGVQVQLRAGPAAPPLRWVEAAPAGRDGEAFVYRLPARVAVEQVDVVLPSDNMVAAFDVASREAPDGAWRPAPGLTAFRLRGAGLSLASEPVRLAPTRAREWRLETRTSLAQPPVLRLGARTERWLLLTHGPAPYVVVAGSQRARREEAPLEALVGQLREKYGERWEPPEATLGPRQVSGGEAALQPPPPDRTRWVLWAVLVAGALGVIAMVLRLLRNAPTQSPGAKPE